MNRMKTILATLLLVLCASSVFAADPTSIANCDLYLRADTGITLASGRVSAWADQSGAGNNVTQATAAKQPPYQGGANPAVCFETFSGSGGSPASGIGYSLTVPTTLSNNRQASSGFMVVDNVTPCTGGVCYLSDAGIQYMNSGNNSAASGRLYGGGLNASGLAIPAGPCIIGYVASTTAYTLYVNGKAVAQAALSAATQTGLNIGNTAAGSQQGAFDLRCFAHYSVALTGVQVVTLSDYFAKTYKINLNPSLNIVFDGDSITDGWGSSMNNFWVSKVLQALGPDVQAFNAGAAGQIIGDGTAINTIGYNAPGKIDTLISATQKNLLVIFAGTNEIAAGGNTGTVAYNHLVTYCQARRAAGWKIVVVTCLPRTGNGASGGVFEVDRSLYNTAIRGGWTSFADALADVGGDSRIGTATAYTNTSYFNTDGIHPVGSGHEIIAQYITAAVKSLINPAPTKPVGRLLSFNTKKTVIFYDDITYDTAS